MWEREGEAWSEDETVSSCGSQEGNVGNDALHVIGLCGPGDKISLFLLALSCHVALDMLWDMHEAWFWGIEACCHGVSALLSWTGCDS